jgi:DNA polymerase V
MNSVARRIALSDRPIPLRLFSEVACGWPSPAADYEETPLSLDELVNVSAYSMFLVRARGNSMYPLIRDGDVLVVDKSAEAVSGDVVVAVIAGDFTVKRLGEVDGRDALIPENRRLPPIILGDDEHIEVWGVVLWNLHRLERGRPKSLALLTATATT